MYEIVNFYYISCRDVPGPGPGQGMPLGRGLYFKAKTVRFYGKLPKYFVKLFLKFYNSVKPKQIIAAPFLLHIL